MTRWFSIVTFFLGSVLALVPGGAQAQIIDNFAMGSMMWLMVVFWLLIALGLVLGIAALIKYLFKK